MIIFKPIPEPRHSFEDDGSISLRNIGIRAESYGVSHSRGFVSVPSMFCDGIVVVG
jgi:hypothetical protein